MALEKMSKKTGLGNDYEDLIESLAFIFDLFWRNKNSEDPMDGDQVQEVAEGFRIWLDFFEGNLDGKELNELLEELTPLDPLD